MFILLAPLFVSAQSPVGDNYSNCYTYDQTSSAVGQTTPITITSGGSTKTISIINSNPASLFQTFVLNSSTKQCALPFWDNDESFDRVKADVVTTQGNINFPGSIVFPTVIQLLEFPFVLSNAIYPGPIVAPGVYEGLTHFITKITYGSLKNITVPPTIPISSEDAIINSIAQNNKLNLRMSLMSEDLDSGVQYVPRPFFANVSAPATNCVKLGGNGPRKIVFMRGTSWNSSVNDFLWQASNIIDNGFKAIDPFKKYQDRFSFYVDLKKVLEHNLTNNHGDRYDSGSPIVTSSSCGNDASEYIFLFDNIFLDAGWADGRVVFMNVPKLLSWPIPDIMSFVAIHESGHVFGYLSDEYLYGVGGSPGEIDKIHGFNLIGDGAIGTNCTLNPSKSYTYDDGTGLRWYGANSEKGCSFVLDSSNYDTYYKPSSKSIMNRTRDNVRKFNVISCGYVISSILGENLTKENAAKHWPECMTLDTIKDVSPLSKKIVAIGGIGSKLTEPMFNFIENIASGSSKIALGGNGVAQNNAVVRNKINTELTAGNKVIVFAHSLGAVIAYNLRGEFAGKPVEFMYIDPPYYPTLCDFTPGKFFSATLAAICKAYRNGWNGIEADPNTINWTTGAGRGKNHDPWTSPQYGTNRAKLLDLKNKVQTRLSNP